MALCLHIGDSPRAGHYLTVVQNIKAGIWRRYNDDNGTKQLEQKLLGHATHYICFYKGEKLQLKLENPSNSKKGRQSNIIYLNSSSESDNDK